MTPAKAKGLATRLLDQFKVKHPKLWDQLYREILLRGQAPAIRVYFCHKGQDIKLEIAS